MMKRASLPCGKTFDRSSKQRTETMKTFAALEAMMDAK
jgi:hypothetical protein